MSRSNLRMLLFSSLLVAMMAFSARIQIPIPPYPVPMTLQTAFVYLCGLLLPRRYALLTQFTYILLGLLGLPVFTSGGGIGYVLDPRFGYLLGFLLCSPLLGLVADRTLRRGHKAVYAAAGAGVILLVQVMGVLYMALLSLLYLKTQPDYGYLLYLLVIFLPLDAIKLYAATLLSKELHKRLPGYFGQLQAVN